MSEQKPEHHPETPTSKNINQPLLRVLVFAAGWLSVALGVIGIFLPVLPTTPFLLLAAACFLRTSPRFYHWLISHPKLGKYLLYYLNGKGIPKKAKVYTLLLMWFSLISTAFIFVPRLTVQIILPLVGIGVSIYILRLPTLELPPKQTLQKNNPK